MQIATLDKDKISGHWTTEAELTWEEIEWYGPLLAGIAGGIPHLEQVADGLYITHMTIILMGPDLENHVEWHLKLGYTE